MVVSSIISQTNKLGAFYDTDNQRVSFNVFSANATRIELYLYNNSINEDEKISYVMQKDQSSNIWGHSINLSDLRNAGIENTIYYGYRAWGPNWEYDSNWTKGSSEGFRSDVDENGNRFNPNKLLLDPYAREINHDPETARASVENLYTYYASGEENRNKDSGKYAQKGILLMPDNTDTGIKPDRALKDDIIYEVHIRGLTMLDCKISPEYHGTYRGAAIKAPYLKNLGVTAVEFLPLQEFQDEQNDVNPLNTRDTQYWGYETLAFFAPNKRYSYDKSPGGPTREFKEMVKAFHDQGIKVFMDVVYNHTGEGGLWNNDPSIANIISWRGLDNSVYYELAEDPGYYYDNTGVYGNFNTANNAVRDLIINSLKYWKDEMGVDGFRFDLASVLGNTYQRNGFNFNKMDPENALNRAANELPVRNGSNNGADLIAEPWGVGDGTYQVGNFPSHWAEWNGKYRDLFRTAENKLGLINVTPGNLATRIAGSSDLFGDDGRKPWHSINYIVSHDGFTLKDLYSFDQKNNIRKDPWCGSSDGGSDNNISWDHDNNFVAQRQAARNGMAFMMLSAGVPMFTGGDEVLRSVCGNNNAYNLDIPINYIHWDAVCDPNNPQGYDNEDAMPWNFLYQGNVSSSTDPNSKEFDGQTSSLTEEQKAYARKFYLYSKELINFRNRFSCLRPNNFYSGTDYNGSGLKDITWYQPDAYEAYDGYFNNPNNFFLAYRIDASKFNDEVKSIYVGYNRHYNSMDILLPTNSNGSSWYRSSDTSAWMEDQNNFKPQGQEDLLSTRNYTMQGRSVLLLIEK